MTSSLALPDDSITVNESSSLATDEPERRRNRSKPGERRVQILQTLAEMLEYPKSEKITTAALAAKLDVSEAALYRHFASKAQMFEGLIEFAETTILGLINQISAEQPLDKPGSGIRQAHATVAMLLRFAEQNRGMTRVLIGEALIGEHERLQERVNQLYERIELALKQSLRVATAQGDFQQHFDAGARANLLMSYVAGKWHRFSKSGWQKAPTSNWDAHGGLLLADAA